MAEQELSLLIRLRDEVSSQLRHVNENIEANARTWQQNFGAIQAQARTAAISLGVFGTAVLGALGLSANAALDEEIGIRRLTTAMDNVGLSYKRATSEGLERWIAATQRATGVADSELRSGLSQLIPITKDVTKAQEMLMTALNLSAGTGKEFQSSILLMTYALSGNWGMVERYVPAIKQAQNEQEKWRMLQQLFANQAETTANPVKVLQNAVSDLSETIGKVMLPALRDAIDNLVDVVGWFEKWAQEHPAIIKLLTDFGIAIGIASIATSGLILAALGIAAAFSLLPNPIFWTIVIIGALIAAGIMLILNWEKVKRSFISLWGDIVNVANSDWGILLGGFRLLIQAADGWIKHWDSSKGFWANIWNEIKFITLTAVNDILDIINILLKAINTVFKTNLSIPKLTEEQFGIYTAPKNRNDWSRSHSGISRTPSAIPGTSEDLAPLDMFGNYGNLGRTGIVQQGDTTITFNIQGDITSERDFFEKVRQYFIQLGFQNATTGIK